MALLLGTALALKRQELTNRRPLIFLPFLSVSIHVLPLFAPFFVSVTSAMKKYIKALVFVVSAMMALGVVYFFYHEVSHPLIRSILVVLYVTASLFECGLFFTKWVVRYRRRAALKTMPVIKRRFGKEIKLPLINVSVEVKHLRMKKDFVVNGTVYIRKGETVEYLKTIGTYYSVRKSTGAEFIVARDSFF